MAKRRLTCEEINAILDYVTAPIARTLPDAVLANVSGILRERFASELCRAEVYPAVIPRLKEQMRKEYINSVVAPGECVGIICAQSIGERQTQTTLNQFHSAGLTLGDVVSGIPRFTALLNASKDPKSTRCTVFFKDPPRALDHLRERIGHTFVGLRTRDLLARDYSEDHSDPPWHAAFALMHDIDLEAARSTAYQTTLRLDVAKLYEYAVPLEVVARAIRAQLAAYGHEERGAVVFHSPQRLATLDLFHEDLDAADVALQAHVCGIEGVHDIVYARAKSGEWYVETLGGKTLQRLLGHPRVDSTRTVSDDAWEIYNAFGIEAVRQYLLEEFQAIAASDGSSINDVHGKLLVDMMTFSGTLISINRYGLKKENCGPISKASFEEAVDHLVNAGLFGMRDNASGCSASIILGKTVRSGTGAIDVCVDIPRILRDVRERGLPPIEEETYVDV